MYYYGQIANLIDEQYFVTITTNQNAVTRIPIKFADHEPIVITTQSDSLFSPIKSRTCTLSIVTDEAIFDLYTAKVHGAEVQVIKLQTDEFGNNNNTGVFHGWLTPCAYTQPYVSPGDVLQLEAVDTVSTLKDIKYSLVDPGAGAQVLRMDEIFYRLFHLAGGTGRIYFCTDSYSGLPADSGHPFRIFQNYSVAESNFFDDDSERTPWTCYEVMEEMLRIFGFVAVSHNYDLWILQYDGLSRQRGINALYFEVSEFHAGTSYIDSSIHRDVYNVSLGKDDYASDQHSISLDDVYNKITVNDSIYEVSNITSNLMDDEQKNYAYVSTQAKTYHLYHSEKKFLHSRKTTLKEADYMQFQLYYIPESTSSNWTFHYHALIGVPDFSDLPDESYWQTAATTSPQSTDLPRWTLLTEDWNGAYAEEENMAGFAAGAFIENVYSINLQGSASSKVNNNKYICFHTFNEKYVDAMMTLSAFSDLSERADQVRAIRFATFKPVLSYDYPEELCYTSQAGASFLCFKGDLMFCWNKNKYNSYFTYEDNNKKASNFIPQCDYNSEVANDKGNSNSRDVGWTNYNFGWPVLEMRLKIGDDYWNGNTWQTKACTFWIYYHKETMGYEQDDRELFTCGEWMHPVYNTYVNPLVNYSNWSTYYRTIEAYYTAQKAQGIGQDYVAIPLWKTVQNAPSAVDYSHPIKGPIHIEIMPPNPHQYQSRQTGGGNNYPDYAIDPTGFLSGKIRKENISPNSWMKDFELVYKFVPNGQNWTNVDDYKSGDDIIYSGIIDTENVMELDDIECKINSAADRKPLSKSYLCTSSVYPVIENIPGRENEYPNMTVQKIWGSDSMKKPEQLLIDQYLHHYSTPKKIYECDTHMENIKPYTIVQPNVFPDTDFFVEAQEWRPKEMTNRLKLVEY